MMRESSKFKIAIYEWLKKIPPDELDSSNARSIVEEFRAGFYSYHEASQLMSDYCGSALNKYIRENEDLIDL